MGESLTMASSSAIEKNKVLPRRLRRAVAKLQIEVYSKIAVGARPTEQERANHVRHDDGPGGRLGQR